MGTTSSIKPKAGSGDEDTHGRGLSSCCCRCSLCYAAAWAWQSRQNKCEQKFRVKRKQLNNKNSVRRPPRGHHSQLGQWAHAAGAHGKSQSCSHDRRNSRHMVYWHLNQQQRISSFRALQRTRPPAAGPTKHATSTDNWCKWQACVDRRTQNQRGEQTSKDHPQDNGRTGRPFSNHSAGR